MVSISSLMVSTPTPPAYIAPGSFGLPDPTLSGPTQYSPERSWQGCGQLRAVQHHRGRSLRQEREWQQGWLAPCQMVIAINPPSTRKIVPVTNADARRAARYTAT